MREYDGFVFERALSRDFPVERFERSWSSRSGGLIYVCSLPELSTFATDVISLHRPSLGELAERRKGKVHAVYAVNRHKTRLSATVDLRQAAEYRERTESTMLWSGGERDRSNLLFPLQETKQEGVLRGGVRSRSAG